MTILPFAGIAGGFSLPLSTRRLPIDRFEGNFKMVGVVLPSALTAEGGMNRSAAARQFSARAPTLISTSELLQLPVDIIQCAEDRSHFVVDFVLLRRQLVKIAVDLVLGAL